MPTIALSTNNPTQLHFGGTGRTVVIANQDPTNTVVTGSEQGIFSAQASVGGGVFTDPTLTMIAPGTSYTFDGAEDIWGIALSGAPNVNISVGSLGTQSSFAGTNFVSPSTLINPGGIRQKISISGGNNFIIPATLLNQAGYELQIQLGINAGSTEPFIDMFMMWSDSVSGLTIATEEWVLAAGPSGNANIYMIKGPTKGNELSINLVNLDPTFTITAIVTVAVNSRGWTRDRIYTLQFNTPPSFPGNAAGRGFTNVIASVDNQVIHAGNTLTRILPPYAGDVWLWVDQQGNAAGNSNLTLQLTPTSVFGTASIFGASPSGGPPSGVGIVKRFHRGHVVLNYANTGSVDSTVNIKVIALDERN